MIRREELELGNKLLYTPGGIELTVVDLAHYCIGVEDEDGELFEIPPNEESEYEVIT